MARAINKLTSARVRTLTKPGLHSDGDGLYLAVSSTGARSWRYIYRRNGKRTELGLGPYPEFSLSDARTRRDELNAMRARGGDPLTARKGSGNRIPAFGEFATELIDRLEPGWKNAKHRQQWRNTLATYAAPIWEKRVDEVAVEDLIQILEPIWLEKHETASRLRGRIEVVLEAAKKQRHRSGENPATWRGNLERLLPRVPKRRPRHHAAMPYEEVPEFMARLRSREGLAPRALELLIHTAARTSEVLEATWSEFDLEGGLWIIPEERMKAGTLHRVPLTEPVLRLIKSLPTHSEFLFPGLKPNRPLSNMAMLQVLRRMGAEGVTVHGFRSSFRDWAADVAHAPREIAEAALAHQVGSEVERAYRRGDALEQRRVLMINWSKYLTG